MMNNIEAVIFDLDGVIIDSEPLHKQVITQILNEFNTHITEEEHDNLIGSSNHNVWKHLKKKCQIPILVEELEEKSANYALSFLDRNHLQPIDGIVALIEKYKLANLKLAVASSSDRKYIEKVLQNFKLTHNFDVLVSGAELPHSKPDPAIFLKTAALLQVAPEKCLVIEDSYNGVIAAKSAGMQCIGFKNMNSGEQDLSKADKIVYSISEIQKVLFT